jgi:hypothetical protein
MARELQPIDISAMPELAHLVEEVAATGRRRRLTHGDRDVAVLVPAPSAAAKRRRPIPAAQPAADPDDPVIAELERRRRQGLNLAEMTAGILAPYAKTPPPTPREEKDAFEQGVAEQVMESLRE